VQLGVEATPGTAVAANKRLLNLGLATTPNLEFNGFRPHGAKFKSSLVPGKDFTAASYDGLLTYSEIVYLLSSLVGYAAPVQQGATTAWKWTHETLTYSEDTVKTFTFEQGSAARAHKFAFGQVTGLNMEITRDAATIGGAIVGQALSDGIALTGAPSAIENMPIVPKHVSVYLDSTSAGLGATKLLRVLKTNIALESKFGPLWAVDGANASFANVVETEPAGQFKLLVEADSAGMAHLVTARAGSTRFCRVEAVSDVLAGTAFPYKLTLDLAGQVSGVSELQDSDGTYAIEYTFDLVHDGTYGKALSWAAINKLTTL
jgi:hypothetical protein